MKFDIEDFKNHKYAIRCENELELIFILGVFSTYGLKDIAPWINEDFGFFCTDKEKGTVKMIRCDFLMANHTPFYFIKDLDFGFDFSDEEHLEKCEKDMKVCEKLHLANTLGLKHPADVSRIVNELDADDNCQATPDNVNHPNHYQGQYECIDLMVAMFGVDAVKGFCKCNSFKYRFRADRKNGAEDIQKAEFYEDYLMKLEGKGND